MSSTSPKFDKLAFKRYIKDIGRAYRKQATELISISRTFVQVQEQTPDSDARLRKALELVDDALKAATEAKTKILEEADEKFSKAIESLKKYEEDYHPNKSVEARMKEAKTNDKSSLGILNRLKEKVFPIETVETKKVVFLLQKSLLDASPTPVIQELCGSSGQEEVLWNFSRFKDGRRLTLKQNPHFYTRLPMSSKQYGDKYTSGPINHFRHEMISVLTDGPDRVYMEIAEKRRAFGGVWMVNNAIIFKDVCGQLEGEGLVGGAIQNTYNLSCFEESLQSTIQDWRQPIITMLQSQGVDRMIHITANQPGSCSPCSSSPSRPRPRSLRDRNPHPIRGTYRKSQNSKQCASPPTASTNVLPSSSAPTAAPPSSVASPLPRTSPTSPHPAPTSVPLSSEVLPPPRKSPTPLPQPAPTSEPPSSEALPPPRTSPVSPRQPVSSAAPPSSVASPPPRKSPASLHQPACTSAPPSSEALPPPRTSPVSSRQPVSTAAPPSSVPLQPRPSSALSPRPASTAATIPHPPSPQPPPTSASRVTRVTESAPSIAPPPLDVSPNREPHGGALQGAVPGTSRSTISKATSSDRSEATNPSLGVGRTGHEGINRRNPIQTPGHSPRVEDARTPVPVRDSPPPPVQAQVVDSRPKTQPASRKKNWFQAHVWDYGNK